MTFKIINWIFGLAVFANGMLNLFLGNDPGLGATFLVLSFVYFPPANTMLKKRFGFSIPDIVKIVLGILIIWVIGAVGAIGEGYLF